jgi:hypothetical protein
VEALAHYIGRHWRGEQNIVWSLLVNGVVVYVLMILGVAVLSAAKVTEGRSALFWPIFAVWFAWALTGTTRPAISTLRDEHG